MDMPVIGLTGNIGSGKTTVSKILSQEKQCHCLNSDLIGKLVVEPDGEAYADLRKAFDNAYFQNDGKLNRLKIADLVFNDSAALKRLNDIIHPAVLKHLKQDIKTIQKDSTNKIIVVEAALLVEANYLDILDQLWLVWADDSIRLKRVMKRDGLTEKQALARMNSQMPQQEKAKYAQQIIHNNSDIDCLRGELDIIWQTLW